MTVKDSTKRINISSAGCVVILHSTTKTTPSCSSRSWKLTMSLMHRTGMTYQTQVRPPLPPPSSTICPSASSVHHVAHMAHTPPFHHSRWFNLHGMKICESKCAMCGFIHYQHSYGHRLEIKPAFYWLEVYFSHQSIVVVDKIAFMGCQEKLCVFRSVKFPQSK